MWWCQLVVRTSLVRLLSLSLHRAKNRSRDGARYFCGSDFHIAPNHPDLGSNIGKLKSLKVVIGQILQFSRQGLYESPIFKTSILQFAALGSHWLHQRSPIAQAYLATLYLGNKPDLLPLSLHFPCSPDFGN